MAPDGWGDGSEARRVRIYLTEEDAIGGAHAQNAIMRFLRKHDVAGVTVMRGTDGFGASRRAHAARLADVPWDLPIILEWVDTPSRVDELLPELKRLVPAGMITVDPTTVVLFARRPVPHVPDDVPVRAIMTTNVAIVRKDTPVREVVELMRSRSLRAVPVVDHGLVVGMITSSDLVRRADLGVRLSLFPGLPDGEQHRRLQALPARSAEQIMTTPPVVVASTSPLSDAAETMVRRKLKRLPVVDEQGMLVGIVSRVDLLRTIAGFGEARHREPVPAGFDPDAPLSSIMREDVPTVYPDSPLQDVVQAVISTRLNRALVVDAERHVLGIVSARAVLARVTPALHPTLLRSLVRRLPFLHPSEEQREDQRLASARAASDLMNTDVLRASPQDPIRTAIAAMVDGGRKLVAVVDDDGRLLGVVDRADLLRGILEHPA